MIWLWIIVGMVALLALTSPAWGQSKLLWGSRYKGDDEPDYREEVR